MDKVLEVLSDVTWDSFVADMTSSDALPEMSRAVTFFDQMRGDAPKQFQGVLLEARHHLDVWEGGRVAKVTQHADWEPADLLKTPCPTVYLAIPPEQIRAYASVLRVIIGQHINAARSAEAKGQQALFMLDELPQLGSMEPVKKAIEVGRGKVRLWMFAQSISQLEQAYGRDAATMLSGCGVRIFMNPSQEDGGARRVSEMLGYREGLLESKRVKLAEATDLTGADYRDVQVVFGDNVRPALVEKSFAWADEELKARMGAADRVRVAVN